MSTDERILVELSLCIQNLTYFFMLETSLRMRVTSLVTATSVSTGWVGFASRFELLGEVEGEMILV